MYYTASASASDSVSVTLVYNSIIEYSLEYARHHEPIEQICILEYVNLGAPLARETCASVRMFD